MPLAAVFTDTPAARAIEGEKPFKAANYLPFSFAVLIEET